MSDLQNRDERPDDNAGTPLSSRRAFLRDTAVGVGSLLAFPALLTAREPGIPGACGPTTPDIIGPYYRNGIPFRSIIAPANEPGTRLFLRGTVYARDCATPLPGVALEVWQANDVGCYSVQANCNPTPETDAFNLYGRLITDASGAYAMESVRPGRYLNGTTYRPAHIHFRIIPPGGAPVVTQLYFEGDPYIENDPWASEPDAAARIIPLVTAADGLHGVFDITLDHDLPASVEAGGSAGSLLAECRPNPCRTTTRIAYRVPRGSNVQMALYNALGEKVRLLVWGTLAAGDYTATWDGNDDRGARLPAGTYFCQLQVGEMVQTREIALAR